MSSEKIWHMTVALACALATGFLAGCSSSASVSAHHAAKTTGSTRAHGAASKGTQATPRAAAKTPLPGSSTSSSSPKGVGSQSTSPGGGTTQQRGGTEPTTSPSGTPPATSTPPTTTPPPWITTTTVAHGVHGTVSQTFTNPNASSSNLVTMGSLTEPADAFSGGGLIEMNWQCPADSRFVLTFPDGTRYPLSGLPGGTSGNSISFTSVPGGTFTVQSTCSSVQIAIEY